MSASSVQSPATRSAAPSQQATLDALVAAAASQLGDQLPGMAAGFAGALVDVSEPGLEAKEVYRRVKSGKLLKDNSYCFIHLAAAGIEQALRQEIASLLPQAAPARVDLTALSLVPLEEMDTRLAFAALARPFDIAHSEALALLSVRLGMLLGRGVLRAEANPFRPEVFLRAVDAAWREFEPDDDAHGLVQALLRPEMLFDLGPLYEAVGAALARKDGQPGSVDSYRIQKTDDSAAARAARAANRAALAEQLRKLFGDDGGDDGVPLIPDLPGLPSGHGGWRPSAAAGFGVSAPVPEAPASTGESGGQASGAAAPGPSFAHGAPAAPGWGMAAPGMASAGGLPVAGAGPDTGYAAGQPRSAVAMMPGQPAPGVLAMPADAQAVGVAATGAPQALPGLMPAPGQAQAGTGFMPAASGAVHAAPGFVPAGPGMAVPAAGFVAGPGGLAEAGYGLAPAHAHAAPASGADGTQGATHTAIQAVLAGLRPGVVAPLMELLTRIEPAIERGSATAAAGDPGAGIADAIAAAGVAGAAASGAASIPQNVFYLPRLKQSLPKGSLSRGDEHTLDLLSRVFETVLLDDSIAPQTRELLQLLQVPVLKAALADKNFFFEEAHPARRLVDLLTRMGWEQRRDAHDPMVQAMKRSVAHVDGASRPEDFAAAVAELEASLAFEESALEDAIAEPVASAIRQERMAVATRAAREAVALRVSAGGMAEVVSGFLEQRWTTVLTFAYSIEEQKPGAVGNATRAMDDLIWSVKPKPTQEQRKTLIARLPRLLATLNKWLDAIKWQDAERLQFFAQLAEYHASIVRAPIELSPERQLELAVEAAQQDALRRVELENAAAQQQVVQREALSPLDGLERGMWLEFRNAEATRKVKLAWVSPLRTLFIFSGSGRREAFSLTAEKLVEALHAGTARVLAIDGVVGQVLSEAMGQGAVNDASMLAAASRAAAG